VNTDDLTPEERDRVGAAFKRLKPNHRMALVMRKEGFTLAEIAEEIGCSRTYVGHIISGGERRLREALMSPAEDLFGYWRGLGLLTRTANCLHNWNITSIPELCAVSDEELMRIPNFGAVCLRDVHELLREYGHPRDIHPVPTKMQQRLLELRSLLLAYESETIALYDLQREDLSPFDFEGIDRDLTIAKRKAAIERIREKILAYA
jgi:hypothetical protein